MKSPRPVNSTVGSLRMFAGARICGRYISSPQRKLWVHVADLNLAREASDIIRKVDQTRPNLMSPRWGFVSDGCTLTHSWRCGLQIFRWLRQLIDRQL